MLNVDWELLRSRLRQTLGSETNRDSPWTLKPDTQPDNVPDADMIKRDGEPESYPEPPEYNFDGPILIDAINATNDSTEFGGWPYQANQDCTRFWPKT